MKHCNTDTLVTLTMKHCNTVTNRMKSGGFLFEINIFLNSNSAGIFIQCIKIN